MQPDQRRYVVWIPGPADWRLGPAYPSVCHYGGQRTMHELAVAIAATGRTVELRGDVEIAELDRLAEAAGAGPELPPDPRRPTPADVVITPEGQYALTFAQIALSPARVVILLLAPPGLCGWPFAGDWVLESPLTVAIDSLARPEHFRAMAALGFELWTHMPEMVKRVKACGLGCTFIGQGRPLAYPAPRPKAYDVVTLANNRWADLARDVVSHLDPSLVHHEIPDGSNQEVLRQLGQGRVFVHPMRIEGTSRLALEARAMGTVPVVLDSNPFAVGLEEDSGTVTVSTLEQMPSAVASLLEDPRRLETLRERGMRSARRQIDWGAYLARVDAALSSPAPDHPARSAQAAMGEALMERELVISKELNAQIVAWRAQASAWKAHADALAAEQVRVNLDRDALAAKLESERALIRDMQATRAWALARRYWRARTSLRRLVGHSRGSISG